ncbi:MAG: BNR repeat-containing protein [Candidatus Hydrogenedentota bacterium]
MMRSARNNGPWVLAALAGLLIIGGAAYALDPEGLPVLEPDEAVTADDNAWPHFNWVSFDQDKVVSLNGYQYGVYWDADRLLTVARRDLDNGSVDILRFDEYVLAEGISESQQRNAHRNTVVGMSPGDGRLHLSWDHHNNDLNYTRSRPGFLTNPPDEMSTEDFEPRQSLTEGAPQRVTYPRLFNDHKDNLYFFYRSGGSGAGDIAIFEYDDETGDWAIISDQLFGRQGVYPPWNDSESRNAYMHDLLFDNEGRLHITWVYREVGASWASNHDLHYAYSDDQGRTWKNNEGQVIADTREGGQITIDSPGIVVWEIPVFSWLMNQCAMTLDSNNNPHVATYHMEEPYEPGDLQHNPPAGVQDRLNYYHYWRDNNGEWHRSEPLPLPLPRRRPMIVAAPDDTILIYFATNDGFMCHAARAKDEWSEWESFRLTDSQFTVTDATKPDRRLLAEENILSFTADPQARKEGSGFAFLDWRMERLVGAKATD